MWQLPVFEIHAALVAARRAVDRHWAERLAQGHVPGEKEQSVLLCKTAWPSVQYAEFNPRQEGRVGADWLWWFVDDSGECFGLLVQAKSLRRAASGWRIDFSYESGGRPQLYKLLDTARHFAVPAAYLIFGGDRDYRAGLTCGPRHVGAECESCDRSGVAVLSALCATQFHEPDRAVEDAYQCASPLEDLVAPTGSGSIRDLNLSALPDELRRFLLDPQTGAREVAKRFFSQASTMRRGQFALALPEMVRVEGDRVFDAVPTDRGHFTEPYFEHVLRGLRTSLPENVRDFALLRGPEPDPALFSGLDGLVVVHI